MIAELTALTEGKGYTIFFRADKTVKYETLMKVMDMLHQGGAISRLVWSARRDRENEISILLTLWAGRRSRHPAFIA